jgi:hypothetical protein
MVEEMEALDKNET